MKLLPVENGQVTIEAAAKTGYVVYKGSDTTGETDLSEYEWSEGSPVKDTGFNSYSWDYAWTKSSTADTTDHITYSNDNATTIGQGDTNILVQGVNDGTLTQAMTGLEGGKTYSASVFVDVSDGRRASIEVTTPDGKTVSNYTEHYYGVYGSSHSDKKASNYQRIKVQFTVPEGESTALIRLAAAADNARIECYNLYLDGKLAGTTTAQRYTFADLKENTTYTVKVEAVDFGGNTSTAEVKFTTAKAPDTQAPQAPADITAGKVTDGKVNISWTAASDNVGVTGYQVYLNGELYATVTGTGLEITGLKAGSYTVEVYAVDAAGNRSAAASLTLKVEDQKPEEGDGDSSKPDGGSSSGSSDAGNTGNTGNTGTGTATPATGDTFSPAWLLAAMGSALAAFVGLRRRQRR